MNRFIFNLQVFTVVVAGLFPTASPLMANIDYMINQSAEYQRNLSRNGAVDSADIINYNPAGTVLMADGLHVNVSNQMVPMLNFSMWYDGEEYQSQAPVWVIPNAYVLYKKDNFSLFGAFTVPSGGGTLNYKKGVAMMKQFEPLVKQVGIEEIKKVLPGQVWEEVKAMSGITGNIAREHIKGTEDIIPLMNEYVSFDGTTAEWLDGEITGSSMYLAGTIGGAYKINKVFSVSLGVRYMHALNSYTGFAKFRVNPQASKISSYPSTGGIDTEAMAKDGVIDGMVEGVNAEADVLQTEYLDAATSAIGWGLIAGIAVQPRDDMLFTLRFEQKTKLSFRTDVQDGKGLAGMFTDGDTYRRDLPMVIALGYRWDIVDNLSVSTSITSYWLRHADNGADYIKKDEFGNDEEVIIGYDDDYFGYPVDFALGIDYRPIKWVQVSSGFQYTYSGANKDTLNDLEYAVNCITVSLGTRIYPIENMAVTLGATYTHGLNATNSTGVEYAKRIVSCAVGIEYSFFTESSGVARDGFLKKKPK